MAILQDLTQPSRPSYDQLLAKIAELEAAKHTTQRITFKVTERKPDGTGSAGALSVYGLGRFPITMYRSQWERLLSTAPALREFITANASRLAEKPAKG